MACSSFRHVRVRDGLQPGKTVREGAASASQHEPKQPAPRQYSATSALRPGAQGLQHLCIVREPPGAELGVDEGAIRGYVEHAAAAFDDLRLYPEFLGDFGRQTGGPRQVVSAYAVFDGDMHRMRSSKIAIIEQARFAWCGRENNAPRALQDSVRTRVDGF